MVFNVTSLQADLTQPITFKMLISLIYQMFVYYHPLSKYVPDEPFTVFNLKALIIPTSKSCNLDVVFLEETLTLCSTSFSQLIVGG